MISLDTSEETSTSPPSCASIACTPSPETCPNHCFPFAPRPCSAHSLEHTSPAGKLSKIPIDESKIPADDRIPRVTTAAWKYESGAVGQLIHSVSLQGTAYSCELEVYADGYQLRLVDPYNNPTLFVRRPGDDHEEVHRFTGEHALNS